MFVSAPHSIIASKLNHLGKFVCRTSKTVVMDRQSAGSVDSSCFTEDVTLRARALRALVAVHD